ncbi:MAG: hypothetical protein ABID38_01670 [Candidatus Diapherotrites archaeon]
MKKSNLAREKPGCRISRKWAYNRFGEYKTPHKVIVHSVIMARLARNLARQAQKSKGLKSEITPTHFHRAGLLHDVTKKANESNPGHPWVSGKEFFEKDAEVAKLICYHDYKNIGRDDLTFDQKLFIYCDLRVLGGNLVPLEERFEKIKESTLARGRENDANIEYIKRSLRETDEAFEAARKFEELLVKNGINISPRFH